MKAIQYASYAGLGGFTLVDAPKPTPGADEVLVKVHAAGLNPVDIAVSVGYLKDMMPLAFPVTPGGELSGVIETVGSGVTTFKAGDAILAPTGINGAFAEYAIVKAASLTRKPNALNFNEAAGLPVAAATATAALNAGNVGAGTRVLIHAAAGGVGSVLVQLAKARGAEITALASAGNIDFVKSLGADHVVDRASRYEETIRDQDIVIDAFGPEAQARSWGALRRGGALLSLVTAPSEEEAAKHGVRSAMVYGTPTPEAIGAAAALAEAGKLKVHVSRTYPLAEAKAALTELGKGTTRGKLILTML